MSMRIATSIRPLETCPDVSGPLCATLGQLFDVIESLTDEQYTRRPVGVVESSIGAHVRHCLDHVRALLASLATGRLDYDVRERGTNIESNRYAALDEIAAQQRRLVELAPEAIDRSIWLTTLLASDAPAIEVHSSFGREAAYVLSHTIHHNALIGAMVKTLGGWLPERFGYAPSTIARQALVQQHREEPLACVRSA